MLMNWRPRLLNELVREDSENPNDFLSSLPEVNFFYFFGFWPMENSFLAFPFPIRKKFRSDISWRDTI